MRTVAILASLALATSALAQEPPGFAEAQRAAFWDAVQSSPKLEGVDQVIIEGDGNAPIMTGWLQKKSWASGQPSHLERRFWARVDRTCPEIKPSCFRVVGIWSGSELLAYVSE